MNINLIIQHDYKIADEDHFTLISSIIDQEDGTLLGQINLIFCDEASIQNLNKQYRGKDKVTDVLSFPYYEAPTSAEELLGEVFLCVPQTERQATEDDWSNNILIQHSKEEMEMYKLCIHGLLHLRDYDHEKDEDYRVMKLLEDKIMNRFLNSLKS